jgi:hypothetical protein
MQDAPDWSDCSLDGSNDIVVLADIPAYELGRASHRGGLLYKPMVPW